jgi:sphinganine-1-phosphate aldolase
VHAAFQKAAHYFGLTLDLVPVLPSGAVDAASLIETMADDVALVVVSAPSYPHAAMDPIAEVAAAAAERGIACHVDACIGGFVLPFWTGVAAWDLRVPGVTSISADLHKFGYAPKGASVLLQRGRDRQRSQYFATTKWPGYPVVNSTMLGSKSAGPLAAAWAIIQYLGVTGFRELAESCERSTNALVTLVDGIEGLRVVGAPTGPLFAVATDENVAEELRVDPHHWADEARALGWVLQLQPAMVQVDGTHLPRTTHLTVTPVTEGVIGELGSALVAAADSARGMPPAIAELPPLPPSVDSATAYGILQSFGIGSGGLPDRQAPLLALIEALPSELGERLLVELLGRLVEPIG